MENLNKNKANFFNSKIRKIVASLVVSIYLAGQIGVDLRAVELTNPNINAQMNVLNLTAEAGKIIEKYEGAGKEKIYLIQDLHCDESVQKNIEKF